MIYIKRTMAILLVTTFILSGCAGSQADLEEAAQDPLAVAAGNGIFHYGDTREEIEKILGEESDTPMKSLDHYRKYPDGTQIIYRETDGEEIAVFILVKAKEYGTYQGIHVGDKWDTVKGSLGEIAEIKKSALILFQDSEQIDPRTPVEERKNDCISVSYILDAEGKIESITISDHMAATVLK